MRCVIPRRTHILQLLPADELEIHFFYAKHLYKSGLCKISFPNYYKGAGALLAESTATAVGNLSPFYFQLGYELCRLLVARYISRHIYVQAP